MVILRSYIINGIILSVAIMCDQLLLLVKKKRLRALALILVALVVTLCNSCAIRISNTDMILRLALSEPSIS